MNKKLITLIIAAGFISVVVAGCASKPQSASAKEAIDQAQTLQTVEEQVNYLVKEANGFINSEQFEEAISTAKYILGKLDSSSTEAQGIIEKAKVELKKMAEAKAEELKGKVSEKLGSIGQ